MPFVHLHNHTHYSLLDGLTKIDELVNYAKEQGSPAIAITDHGSMYGVIEFYQKCKKAGIKPIIGVEAYLAPASRFDKNTKSDGRNYHLLLLAETTEGYKNLIKLVSAAHLEGYYYKPRIDWELLQQHHQGIIASSACLGGEIAQLILADKLDRARQRILEYVELFGKDNFFLEIMDHPELPGQDKVNPQLIKFSQELGVPLLATNDAHYLRREDEEAQDILLCLQNKKKKSDTNRMRMMGFGNYSVRSSEDMIAAFANVPQAVENTLKVAERCNVEIELGNIQLPHFEVPAGYDGNSYLRYLCEQGIERRYDGHESAAFMKQVRERLDYELSVVEKMGWPSYFLIVSDFVNWAKSNKVVVGPGRGSAAGSLVCYLTGITNLDPLKYDLLFERFLNPDRISMPDIDMDFADTRRDEVIRYVESKYGADHVAQIITFGTMAARAAVRDVGRVLDEPYEYCDKISKLIPMFYKIKEALDEVAEFRDLYQKEPAAKRIIDYAMTLEGVARHTSTHACGVLITKNPLTDYVPIQYASSSDRNIVSQYSLHPVEDLGLLKMDFLGLKNLTIIESALKIIKNTRGLEIDIDSIPLDDAAAYQLFQQGETTGVFQFESSGMKRYLRELKPTELEDIIAMVALYRPGPMEWIPDYIAGKHKTKKISYLHPKLEHILEKTCGVAIYQEQVMQISRDLAGFTKGEADTLRKAMGKKIASLLAEQKEKFINGCVANGVGKELGEKIFSFIEPFAGYGFNRSHAACYALVAYQTAYLKAHWPAEFMAALLTSDQHDIDRVAIEIDECRHMHIQIMPPDINESFTSFTVVTSGTKENRTISPDEQVNTIRFGLNAVKNVGEHIASVIIEERKANGPYLDIWNFLERIQDKDMNKKSLESLIKCGGLDSYGDRGELLHNLEVFLGYNKEFAKLKASRQSSLFGDSPSQSALGHPALKPAPAVDVQERLRWEKDLLGLYVSEHPFNSYRETLRGYAVPLSELAGHKGAYDVKAAGVIASVKKIITRNSQSMLFVKLEDAVSNVELLIFPRILQADPGLWEEGKVVICSGKVSDKDQEVKFLVDFAAPLDAKDVPGTLDAFKKIALEQAAQSKGRQFYARQREANASRPSENKEVAAAAAPAPAAPASAEPPLKLVFKGELLPADLSALRDLLAKFPGSGEVYFKVTGPEGAKIIKTSFRVAASSPLKEAIRTGFSDKITVVD